MNPELDFDDFELCSNAPQLKQRSQFVLPTLNAEVYPNPASGSISVFYPLEESENGKLIIIDLTGRQVFSKEVYSYIDLMDINISSINQGIYSIILSGKETVKLIGQLTIIR